MSFDRWDAEPPPADRRFGLRLRALRLACGLTIRDLAARAGMAEAMLRSFEGGGRALTSSALVQLAPALAIDVARFFDFD